MLLSFIAPILIGLIWVGLVFYIIVKRGLLRHTMVLRLGVLAGFIIIFICITIFFFSQTLIVTTVGVILPALWGFLDSSIPKRNGKKRVTLILKSGTGYCKEVADSIRDEFARRLPDVQLKVLTNLKEENTSEQIITFSNEVRQKPDAIVIIPPPDNSALIPSAVEAHRQKIQLVTVDDEFEPYEFMHRNLPPPIHIGSDFEQGGRLAAQAMLRALKQKGNVAIISGPRSSKPSQIRKLAFIDEILCAQQEIHIISCQETFWNAHEAGRHITELLDAGQLVDGVFCCNDKLALGALDAFKQMQQMHQNKLPRLVIIGFDGIKEIYTAILNGDIYATIEVKSDI